MRLGVVMAGAGAYAAACTGVMKELQHRGMEPYAVCGLQAGAWPAALYAAGMSIQSMEKALQQAAKAGGKLIAPKWYERLAPFCMRMPVGERLNHLLSAQTGQRILSMCPGIAVFPCRMMRTGQRLVFSTRAYMPDEQVLLATQASVSLASRAAMGMAPFLAPMQYMGSHLLGETDAAFACRQLMLLGAHRVLLIEPVPSPRHRPDPLDLAAAMRMTSAHPYAADVGVLRIPMPDTVGALSLSQLEACAQAGENAAAQLLDGLLERMGMAHCRILAFRRRYS